MRTLLLALGLVAVAASPSGAGWATSGQAFGLAGAATLTPVPAPSTAASCLGDGNLGIVVSWSATDPNVTGYELWRVVNGNPSKVTDTPPGTRTANDVVAVGVDLRYYVVSRASAWLATSPTRTVTSPVCTGTGRDALL